MVSIGKSIALILFLLMALSSLSLLIVKPTSAQSIPKPSVPEFSLKFINSSYSVIDQNTDQSEQVVNGTIQITIKNQPFAYSFNDTTYHLYYNLRIKKAIEDNWTMSNEQNPVLYLPNAPYNITTQSISHSFYVWDSPPSQSSSDYTIVFYAWQSDPNFPLVLSDLKIDFQVEAIVGHNSQKWVVAHPLYPNNGGYYEPAIAYDTDSGWSSTQTIFIGETLSASPSPSVPEFPSWIILMLFLATTLLTLLLCLKKRKQYGIL